MRDYYTLSQLLADAKAKMTSLGIIQWNEHYPNGNVIEQDIMEGKLWVLRSLDDEVLCMGTLTHEPLEQGAAINPHQIYLKRVITASNSGIKGLGSLFLKHCFLQLEPQITTIYSCTNHTNFLMRKLLEKEQFVKIGEHQLAGREAMGSFYIYERKLNTDFLF
ncbi:hypothetical protein [Isobaculum melis]|nr:hypothetical protein [Isobaculum melis]